MIDSHSVIAAAVCAVTGLSRGGGAVFRPAGPSALNSTRSLAIAGRRFFVKTSAPQRAAMLEAEADGLAAIAHTNTIRVPMPIAGGVAGDLAYLVLEWLDLGAGGRDAALGVALAALHRHAGARFGWHRDNAIGTTPQLNTWSATWPEFFRGRRLAPQFELALQRGSPFVDATRVLEAVPALLAGHAPLPSLVHGDLWSGNAGHLVGGEPVIFDPATYHGDRETDIAMTELFGGFGAGFYAAYDRAWPREPGYAARRTLYNLYHVLNHFNLFGGGYRAQADSMIGELLARAG